MIYCESRARHIIWTKKYEKTNFIFTVSTSISELAQNIKSA